MIHQVPLWFSLVPLIFAVSTHHALENTANRRTQPQLDIQDLPPTTDNDINNSNDDNHDDNSRKADAATCRVAICFSGHIRSFVYPSVHQSAKRNLVDAIAAEGCRVDVFAYATLLDDVPSFKKVSKQEVV